MTFCGRKPISRAALKLESPLWIMLSALADVLPLMPSDLSSGAAGLPLNTFLPLGAVWWIKRDLRLFDNPALTEASRQAALSSLPLLPLFLFEPSVLLAPETSPFHTQAQRQALVDLRRRLWEQHQSDVLTLTVDAVPALDALYRRHPFEHLVSHQEIGTEITYARDRAVAVWCRQHHVTWTQPPQVGVFRPLKDRDHREALWQQFMNQMPLPVPSIPPHPAWVAELCTAAQEGDGPCAALLAPDDAAGQRQATTEPLAWATLRGFLKGRAARYQGGISSPVTAFRAGSRLSVHLAWGTVSARAVRRETLVRLAALAYDPSAEAQAVRRGLRAFSERLAWRDHFTQRLEDEPGLEFHPPHPLYTDLPIVTGAEAEQRMQALLAGQTGFPLVDACMRCAAETGFLNFRMRAMVTSFASHGLRLDWQTLLAPLARLWTDYEPGIHVSQVQMQAGVVGTNTIRVYSPAKQLRDQDPALTFTRRWLPELLDTPEEWVRSLGEPDSLGWPGYAKPVIDFAAESRVMKDVLYSRRSSPEGEAAAVLVQKRHGSRRARPKRPPRRK